MSRAARQARIPRAREHGRAVARRGGIVGTVLATSLSLIVAGCANGPILANQPPPHVAPPPASIVPSSPPDPQPLAFPRDDGPHNRLTEWWYYTGHLRTSSGRRFGFEFVVFRAERGAFPVTWASHLALTDEANRRFVYAQRSEIGPQVDHSPTGAAGPTGFALGLSGADPTRPGSAGLPAWTMAGGGGRDRLVAKVSPSEAAVAGSPGDLGLDLGLTGVRPIVFHNENGFVEFGPAGGSYYYSRTRMAATGSVMLGGKTFKVDGTAWFDHQWGDFVVIGAGGWDWFAVNLADGSDLMLSLIRDSTGSYPFAYGTLVAPDGSYQDLPRDAFSVTATGTWTSPATSVTYPAGWRIELPAQSLTIELTPTVSDQELDTRPTSGVIYWEGSQRVRATRQGVPVAGEAYVELTGYGR